jgi:uncharacterized protein YajQ (UPF0234 family)
MSKKVKKCILCNIKRPNFNYKEELKAVYCFDCKLEDMVDIKNKKCISCNIKRSSFNYKENKNPTHCKNCKLENMIDIVNKKCIFCKINQPTFNYKEESKALYCGSCKLENMIDVKNKSKQCISCDKRASFNYENNTKALYCSVCKLENMIDIKSKKCITCNNIKASFNYKDETKALYCSRCKLENMVDVKSKKCIECKIKQPAFNFKEETKPIYCGDCKLENMIDVKSKKCILCKNKIPVFNYKNDKQATHCDICKLENMVDVKHKKCILCDFNRINQKFKTFCSSCYRFQNPNSDFTRNYKVKENTIMKFVKEKYPNCVTDSTISGGCSKRRPDGLIKYDLFSIIIEVDENCHRNYEDICENKRLMEIYQDLNFKPLRLIRFNPDAYRDINSNKVDSLFSLDSNNKLKVKTKKELNRRVDILLTTIEKVLENINQKIVIDANNVKSVDVEYLFFNENE